MTIKDAENNYLIVEVVLTDWLNLKFYSVFKSNNGMCEFFIDGVLSAKEIMDICETFRNSVFTSFDNSSYGFEKIEFNSGDDIDIRVNHENRISDIRYLKMSYKYSMYYKDETLVNETMADLIVGKKDLIKAAYDLECEIHNEIENYWKTKLLKV